MRGEGAGQGLDGAGSGGGARIAIGDGDVEGGSGGGCRGVRVGLGGGGGHDDVDGVDDGREIARQVGEADAVDDGHGTGAAGEFELPLDVARVGAGDAGSGGVGQGVGPGAPGAVGAGGVAGAGAEDDGRAGGHIGAPTEAAPARGGAGVMHGGFEQAPAPGPSPIRRTRPMLPVAARMEWSAGRSSRVSPSLVWARRVRRRSGKRP